MKKHLAREVRAHGTDCLPTKETVSVGIYPTGSFSDREQPWCPRFENSGQAWILRDHSRLPSTKRKTGNLRAMPAPFRVSPPLGESGSLHELTKTLKSK